MIKEALSRILEDKGSRLTYLATIVLVAVLVGVLSYSAGVNQAVTSTTVQKKLALDERYQENLSENRKLKDEITEKENLLARLEAYDKIKDKLDEEMADNTAKLSELQSQVSNKTEELSKLTGDILKAQSQPIVLPAGTFTVGEDINGGRYKVTGKSNFLVYSAFGDLKVNTILGGSYGVSEYICNLSAGDIIQAEGRDTYTLIK